MFIITVLLLAPNFSKTFILLLQSLSFAASGSHHVRMSWMSYIKRYYITIASFTFFLIFVTRLLVLTLTFLDSLESFLKIFPTILCVFITMCNYTDTKPNLSVLIFSRRFQTLEFTVHCVSYFNSLDCSLATHVKFGICTVVNPTEVQWCGSQWTHYRWLLQLCQGYGRGKNFFWGGALWDFSKLFLGGTKTGEICFPHSKLRK